MTFGDYCTLVAKTSHEQRTWRIGQTAFNVLADVRPDLAERVRGTNLDPFHVTQRVPKFYEWTEAHW